MLWCSSYAWGTAVTLGESCWQLSMWRLRGGWLHAIFSQARSYGNTALTYWLPFTMENVQMYLAWHISSTWWCSKLSWSTLASGRSFVRPKEFAATFHGHKQPVFTWQKSGSSISYLTTTSSVTPLGHLTQRCPCYRGCTNSSMSSISICEIITSSGELGFFSSHKSIII